MSGIKIFAFAIDPLLMLNFLNGFIYFIFECGIAVFANDYLTGKHCKLCSIDNVPLTVINGIPRLGTSVNCFRN